MNDLLKINVKPLIHKDLTEPPKGAKLDSGDDHNGDAVAY